MPTPAEIQELREKRDAAIAALEAKGEVTTADLETLDAEGRYLVAVKLSSICTKGAWAVLLDDDEYVLAQRAIHDKREAAVASLKASGVITADDLKGLDEESRGHVALSLWPLCTQLAQAALLNDEQELTRKFAVDAQASAADPKFAFAQWFWAKHDVPEGVDPLETFEIDGQQHFCFEQARNAHAQWLSLQGQVV